MKSLLVPMLFILPVALPLAADDKSKAQIKPPLVATAPGNRLQSDTKVLPNNLPDSVILDCVHAGYKVHASDADTLAAVRRAPANHEFDYVPRSVVIKVNHSIPGVEQPMLAFLSDKVEANLCLIGKRDGKIVLISAPRDTVGPGDPSNKDYANWMNSPNDGERYFLLNTRRTDGDAADAGSGQECLRLYSLNGNTLKLSDSACERAGSWSSGTLPGGAVYFKGSSYIPTLQEWNSQCYTVDGVGVPNPDRAHYNYGELSAELFCAGKPKLGDYYYEIQAGKLHIYRTHNPMGADSAATKAATN